MTRCIVLNSIGIEMLSSVSIHYFTILNLDVDETCMDIKSSFLIILFREKIGAVVVCSPRKVLSYFTG